MDRHWSPVDQEHKIGVAICNFDYTEECALSLPLDIGDVLLIQLEYRGWYYACKKYDCKDVYGIVPKSYLSFGTWHAKNTSSDACPRKTLFIQDLSSILREWYNIWKKIYIEGQEDKNLNLNNVILTLNELIEMRSQLMQNPTIDEQLVDEIIFKINYGNAMLGIDMLVCDDQGNLFNRSNISAIDLYQAHEDIFRRIKQSTSGSLAGKRISEPANEQTYSSHNILLMFNKISCTTNEDMQIIMQLYDAKRQIFFTENFILYTKGSLLRNPPSANRVLFSELCGSDLNRERILLVFQIVRIGAMEFKENDSRRAASNASSYVSNPGKGVDSTLCGNSTGNLAMLNVNKKCNESIRRPFGAAVLDITELLTSKDGIKKEYVIPYAPCLEKESLEMTIKKAQTLREEDARGRIAVSLSLLHGTVTQIKDKYSDLIAPFDSLLIARKIGIPEIIVPGEFRNDFYLTLVSGSFNQSRSIEATINVCNKNGDVLDNVITIGAGADFVSEHKSIVYFHEDKPKWTETIKISLSIEEFKQSHIRITFKHRSVTESKDKKETPFAMSFVKLMNDNHTSIRDQEYELLVYKIEKDYDRDNIKKKAEYLRLFYSNNELELKSRSWPSSESSSIHLCDPVQGLTHHPQKTVTISTVLCSTKLTQNPDLVALLYGPSSKNDVDTGLAIEGFNSVDGEDIVKFLQDILDTLFRILTRDSKSLRNAIFGALVKIISLISTPKYHNFRQVLDLYIDKTFSSTLAHMKLIKAMRKYLEGCVATDNIVDGFSNGETCDVNFNPFNVMRSMEYMFKFIVRSRQLYLLTSCLQPNNSGDNFINSMRELFSSMVDLMSTKENFHIQKLCLRHFPPAIPTILKVYPVDSMSYVIAELLDVIHFTNLREEKLLYMLDIIRCDDLFKYRNCRLLLMSIFTENIRTLLERNEEVNLCIQALNEILQSLHYLDVAEIFDDVRNLTQTLLRPIMSAFMNNSLDEIWRPNLSVILLGLLALMTPSHYVLLFDTLDTPEERTSLLHSFLSIFKDRITNPVFSSDWFDMIMLANNIILFSMKQISKIIMTSKFDHELWKNCFDCAVAFATQKPLQIENFSIDKQNRIKLTHIAGGGKGRFRDMRREMVEEIRILWYKMGSKNEVLFLPYLIGPFLEVALLPEVGARKEMIPLFFELMKSEFLFNGNCDTCKYELIRKLDNHIISGSKGDEEFRIMFRDIILARIRDSNEINRELFCQLVHLFNRLMKYLLEYRAALESMDSRYKDNEHFVLCIFNLIEFYKQEVHHQELHLKYLTELTDLHVNSGNFTEAAFTLQLYSLEWSNDPLPSYLKLERYKHCKTLQQLSEHICEQTIEYFEKGEQWEEAIAICDKLIERYKYDTIDYLKLAELLKKQSILHENIINQDRCFCHYYRVSYIGKGFPSSVRNQVFIHKSSPCEMRSDFIKHLQSIFPNAIILDNLQPCSEEMQESSSQYLQVNKVEPVPFIKKEFVGKLFHQNIKLFYDSNRINQFVESKIIDKSNLNDVPNGSENEFCSKYKEKTYFTTLYPLPGVSTLFHVTNFRTITLSPVETAIEDLESTKSNIIKCMCDLHFKPNAKFESLLMNVQGVVHPAVNGGIENYEKAFLDRSDLDEDLLEQLKYAIASLVPVVEIAIGVLKNHISPSSSYNSLFEEILKSFIFMKGDYERKYGLSEAPLELRSIQEFGYSDKRYSNVSENGTLTKPRSSGNFFIKKISRRNDEKSLSSDRTTTWYASSEHLCSLDSCPSDQSHWSMSSSSTLEYRRTCKPRLRSNSSSHDGSIANGTEDNAPPLPVKQFTNNSSLNLTLSPFDVGSLKRYTSLPRKKPPPPPPTSLKD